MKQTMGWTVAVWLCLAGMTMAASPIRVTANRVNLRAAPRANGDLLGQADYDERLTAHELGGEWVEISVPSTVDVWVNKDFVVAPQNTIGANKVNVRAGASINYNVVDTLPLGTPVEVRGEFSGWLKIAPPPTARAWIHRDYIEVLEPMPPEMNSAEASAVPEAAAQEEPVPVAIAAAPATAAEATVADATATEEPAPKAKKGRKKSAKAVESTVAAAADTASALPAISGERWPTPIVSASVPQKDAVAGGEIPLTPPSDLKLVPLSGQGERMEVDGILRAAPLINEAPARYRVMRWQNNRWQILCHVYGAAGKFRSLQNKRVRMTGRSYWIQKATYPVLIPDSVREIPEEAGEVHPEPEKALPRGR